MSSYGKYKSPSRPVTFDRQFSLRHVFRAGAIVWTKHNGKDYYLVFRSLSRPNRGIQLPGGRIEKTENVAETILREVKEETGLECRIICPLGYLYFENQSDNYSNMQMYYIIRPVFPVDITSRWNHIDMDITKQKLECWFIPVEEDHSFLAAGQDKIVSMFKNWLEVHKKENQRPLVNKNFKTNNTFVKKEFINLKPNFKNAQIPSKNTRH